MFGGEPVASFYVELELHQEFGTGGGQRLPEICRPATNETLPTHPPTPSDKDDWHEAWGEVVSLLCGYPPLFDSPFVLSADAFAVLNHRLPMRCI